MTFETKKRLMGLFISQKTNDIQTYDFSGCWTKNYVFDTGTVSILYEREGLKGGWVNYPDSRYLDIDLAGAKFFLDMVDESEIELTTTDPF